jgi:hypothetical protein
LNLCMTDGSLPIISLMHFSPNCKCGCKMNEFAVPT